MLIIYSKQDEVALKRFRCSSRAHGSNKRFDDKICKHDVLLALKRFSFKCAYCLMPLKEESWQLDHFYPRTMGGKNTHENLVPTCKWCNTMKNGLDGFAFITKCQTIVRHNQIQTIVGIPEYKDPGYLTKRKKRKVL